MLKRIIKGLLILLTVLIVGFFILKWSFSEEIPKGESGQKADQLAEQVLTALNASAMQEMDSISWTFRGVNHYNWRPVDALVTVSWDDFKVDLYTQDPVSSTASKNGEPLQGAAQQEAIDYALANFNNDSFWLIAPYKIMDPGTEREWISENELLVRYVSGGTTPGDVYVWQLDNNKIPTSFKMWVQIIPLDGIKADWKGWKTNSAGFKLPESRTMYGLEIPITDVTAY